MTEMSLECVSEETIIELTSQLFAALLPDGDALAPTAPGDSRVQAAESVIATVEIHANAPLRVDIACSRQLAEQVAAAMFATTVGEIDDAAVFDAVGELANIVGGNVKALLVDEAVLTLPALRVEDALPRRGDGPCCDAAFLWRAQPLVVRVVAGTPAAA